ncbi:hypothetical protein TcCL_Unassigned05031 [Trypanosoma cruzi]|nr:hypothetical protein TcCL_Unassigned05031 [Trypanosoma cruzi]
MVRIQVARNRRCRTKTTNGARKLGSVSDFQKKAAEVHHVHAGSGRWAHAEGSVLQKVGATSGRHSHSKVWRTKRATPPARPLQVCWKTPQPTRRVAGAPWCLQSCRKAVSGRCCASRAARAILKGEGLEVPGRQITTRPSSSGLRLLRTPPQRLMPTE